MTHEKGDDMQEFENGQGVEVLFADWMLMRYIGRDDFYHVCVGTEGNCGYTPVADSRIRPVRRTVEELAAEAAATIAKESRDETLPWAHVEGIIADSIRAFAKERDIDL